MFGRIEKARALLAAVIAVSSMHSVPLRLIADPQHEAGTQAPAPLAPVEYVNAKYRFRFHLPPTWKGYIILTRDWEGGEPGKDGVIERGPVIVIRHPEWTASNPREDIPIMVFSRAQWKSVEEDNLIVSAAPIGPSELGHNRKYVFALPPRYNYDFLTGYEEVDTIVQSRPLCAF
jgi:hypothetical protein